MLFGKSEDKVIAKLLRAQLGRPKPLLAACAEFDPELAVAYLERNLAAREITAYEQHLSVCASCRTDLVALARLAEADSPVPLIATELSGRPARAIGGRPSRAFRLLSPQWALAAAAAVTILAVSVPFLWRSSLVSEQAPQGASDQAGARAVPQGAVDSIAATLVDPASRARSPQPQAASDPKSAAQKSEEVKGQAAAKAKGSGTGESAQPEEENAAPEPPQTEKVEAGAPSGGGDLARSAASEAKVPAPESESEPPPPAEEQKRLAKIDSDAARKLPEAGKDSVKVEKLRPSRVDGATKRDAASTIRPQDAIAPPVDRAGGERARGTIAQGTIGNALHSSSSVRAERGRGLPERKVKKKIFWLMKGTWTDKDFDPGKNMPVVTLVRDSDVYREELAKHNRLKVFCSTFGEGERAIIVYKDAVYKLIPQDK